MFKNSQNCVPEPISIIGTVSDSLATLDEKEVTFIPDKFLYLRTQSQVAQFLTRSPHRPKPTWALQRSAIQQPLQHLIDFDKPISDWSHQLEI